MSSMAVERAEEPSGGHHRLLRPTLVVTAFTITAQVIGVLTQIVLSALFGTGPDLDAYLAANTLPQYFITVLTSTLGFVFIPVFIEYATSEREDDAWLVASSIINACLLILGILVLGGMLFASPLLRLTVPGLRGSSLELAAHVALITWPAIIPVGALSLLTGVYQARERFTWPATVGVIGAAVNLILLVALARKVGVFGIAVAGTASAVIQAALLLRVALGPGRYKFVLDWRHPGVRQVFHLFLPLVIAGLFIRWTPVVDRYLASNLQAGSISQLSYAFRLLGLASLLISTGMTTVVFPRMALSVAVGDMPGMRSTVSLGLRVMWIAVAPAMTLGCVLALPLVTVAFRHGRFTASDAQVVAHLLRLYLLALAAMALGNITGRVFYAMKRTRLVAGVGIVEAFAYAIYTSLFARRFGTGGVALGFVIYFNLSLLWQFVWIRSKTGHKGGHRVAMSFARTGMAALAAAGLAWLAIMAVDGALAQLIVGGLVGMAAHIILLFVLGSEEMGTLYRILTPVLLRR